MMLWPNTRTQLGKKIKQNERKMKEKAWETIIWIIIVRRKLIVLYFPSKN